LLYSLPQAISAKYGFHAAKIQSKCVRHVLVSCNPENIAFYSCKFPKFAHLNNLYVQLYLDKV